MRIITALKEIFENLQKYDIEKADDFSMFDSETVNELKEYLGVTSSFSILLFSIIFERTVIARSMSVADLRKYFPSTFFVIERHLYIEEMEKKGLIVSRFEDFGGFEIEDDYVSEIGEMNYRVKKQIVKCIMANEGIDNAWKYIGEAPKTNKITNEYGLILPSEIETKTLFYNTQVAQKLNELKRILLPRNFLKLTQKLEEKNMSKQLVVLLEGSPGTGKSSFVFNLAKQTGRSIMKVPLLKNKYFGQTEQNISNFVKQCQDAVKNINPSPIVFFEEFEQYFGARKDAQFSSVAETENAIKSLLLDKLEAIEGIIFLCGNMPEQMDKAFERRISIKINISLPDAKVICKIIQHHFPWLQQKQAIEIAQKYMLTGGEIANIAKKSAIHELLYNERASATDIDKFCQEERISALHSCTTKIGFKP